MSKHWTKYNLICVIYYQILTICSYFTHITCVCKANLYMMEMHNSIPWTS
jgi:hypothetical protein